MTNTQYTTVADIKAYFDDNYLNQFTIDTGETSTTDDTVIGAAVDASNNLIDGFVSKRYFVPITDSTKIPDILKQVARYFTYYDLYIRRDGFPDEKMLKQREEYMGLLKGIAKGDILLDGLDIVNGNVIFGGRRLVFTDDILNMY